MLDTITFKTEISEILSIEEIAILFDCIPKKYTTELVSLSIFPQFNKLKKDIIEKASKQRNFELSKLLTEIYNRKQESKISIWKILGTIGNNKRDLFDSNLIEELEQTSYEQEQIINVYENSMKALENKEKRIMNGKYSRVDNVKPLPKRRTLKKQLEELKNKIMEISKNHNNCFIEFEERLSDMIEKTVLTDTNFSKNQKKAAKQTINLEEYKNNQTITIENIKVSSYKDFYQYEPNIENIDDELIYELLEKGNYDYKDGTINALPFITEYEYYEEV